jgi:hypothetical protein
MRAYELLTYVGLGLPFLLAALLLLAAPGAYRSSFKLFLALLVLSHGSLGIWVAVRTILNLMPFRPIDLVPQNYVVGTANLESIVVLVVSSIIARRVLFPGWGSFMACFAKYRADEPPGPATEERA